MLTVGGDGEGSRKVAGGTDGPVGWKRGWPQAWQRFRDGLSASRARMPTPGPPLAGIPGLRGLEEFGDGL